MYIKCHLDCGFRCLKINLTVDYDTTIDAHKKASEFKHYFYYS